jgi:hypothetical protein
MIKEKSPKLEDFTSGSPWALISVFPAAFQQRLGHSPSDRGHQALRYHCTYIVAHCCYKSIGKKSSGSPWALISVFPAAFTTRVRCQQKLGHSTSDRGHQALRYRSALIVAHGCYKPTKKIERLTPGSNLIHPGMEGERNITGIKRMDRIKTIKSSSSSSLAKHPVRAASLFKFHIQPIPAKR